MKKVLFGLFAIVSVSSMATSLHPDTFAQPESVTIVRAETIDNQMPVIPVGGRKPYTILTVDVTSTGCTSREDFKVVVDAMQHVQTVEIVRVNPDFCEVAPHTKQIQLRTEDIRAHVPLRVRNPLLVDFQVVH